MHRFPFPLCIALKGCLSRRGVNRNYEERLGDDKRPAAVINVLGQLGITLFRACEKGFAQRT